MNPQPKHQTVRSKALMVSMRGKLCVCCRKSKATTGSHIKGGRSGGPDTEWNVVPMCLVCHQHWGHGRREFLFREYRWFRVLLEEMGWEISQWYSVSNPRMLDREIKI